MRFAIQIILLVVGTVFLALQIPRKALFPHVRGAFKATAPFAVYVELGEEEYANRMKLARMAWQVRARAAGRLDLEDGTPLVEEAMPPPPPPALGFPSAVPPPSVSAEAASAASLAPPSLAAPESEALPPMEDRRRDLLLDLSEFETINEKETSK